MLGHDLVSRIADEGFQVTAIGHDCVDITDAGSVSRAIRDTDVVVNAAAFTAVDAAEAREPEAFAVNAIGPQMLARRCSEVSARLVQISTDYVFDGNARFPYDEDAELNPRSAYGRSKAAGEWAVRANTEDYLIVRTAWLYGRHGKCFPRTMRDLSENHATLNVVTDQVGQPTWTVDLADLIVRLVLAAAPSGIYHGTSSGETSWNGFAKEVMISVGKDSAIVRPTTADAFKRAAMRPHYSVLGHKNLAAIGVAPIGDWRERWNHAAPIMFRN
jgi:dTDP-4-dehydrorhamnose reductase